MSTKVIERAGGRDFGRGSDGKESASRSYLVYDTDGAVLSPDEILDGQGMPRLGDTHPDKEQIFANAWRLSLSGDRQNAWEVTWTYGTYEPVIGDGGDDADETLPLGVQGYSMSVGVTIIDIWKSGPTLPADKSAQGVVDIGGTLVAEGGQPLSMALPTGEIVIRERSTGFFSGGQYINQVGKRNLATWQSFPPGSLLFTGMNVNHTKDGANEIEYSLSYDRWYHLRQVPERDDAGDVIITAGAINVYFKQPFPDTVSFGFLPM